MIVSWQRQLKKHGEIRALIFQTLYDDFSAHELYQLIRDGHTDSGVMYPDHEVHTVFL